MASTRLITSIAHPKHSTASSSNSHHNTGMMTAAATASSSSANGTGQDERLLSRHSHHRHHQQTSQHGTDKRDYGAIRSGGNDSLPSGNGVSFEDTAERGDRNTVRSRSHSSASSSSTTTTSSTSTSGSIKLADVTYRSMMFLYWLIPITIGLVFYSLVLLGKYAW